MYAYKWLIWHIRIDWAQLPCCWQWGDQACVSLPIRADWTFRIFSLKETGAKIECFRQRCKPVIMNLKVSTLHFLHTKINEPSFCFFSNGIHLTLVWACHELWHIIITICINFCGRGWFYPPIWLAATVAERGAACAFMQSLLMILWLWRF